MISLRTDIWQAYMTQDGAIVNCQTSEQTDGKVSVTIVDAVATIHDEVIYSRQVLVDEAIKDSNIERSVLIGCTERDCLRDLVTQLHVKGYFE
ncbi:hypothetical protein [Klebsiella phage KL01]|uniref:Uncharacterized protein n=1 Tax=Klebsiella phage KL01 TaxID=3077152 RepID=A0AA96T6H3_9CAUD|nr:hypothetical protein [Sphingobacterium alkalisoli]WNV46820.1 hypothetical protein [Klebsiella phage KL01]GGH32448.1 hypothetical protein GCM10011418_45960 [Sphingobacterium alkalisoli]